MSANERISFTDEQHQLYTTELDFFTLEEALLRATEQYSVVMPQAGQRVSVAV